MRLVAATARFIVSGVQYFFTIDDKKRKKFAIYFFAVFFLFGVTTFYFWIDFKSVKNLKKYKPPIPSQLLDRNGRLISTFFTDNRIMTDIDKTPPYLASAFVAMEDNRFYVHHGIDLQGIVRAFLKNILTRQRQGGSTITQQVAKVILTNRSRTYARKIREAALALYLDHLFSKKKIMNLYFNEIYFGHGNYGVAAASQFYFDKPVSDINLGEAAILASLPSAPNYYSPVKNPHLSRQRTILVLLRMIDMNFITRADAEKAFDDLAAYYSNLNISPDSTAFGQRLDRAPYFTEYMRGILEEKVGKENLYEKGLIIKTSLDLDHQDAAQKALWEGLQHQTEQGYEKIFTHHLEFSDSYSLTTELIRDVFGLPEFEVQKSYSQFQLQLEFYKDLYENLELLNLAVGSHSTIDDFIDSLREANPYLPHITPPQGALIEIDQKTGEVTAMVGGSPFSAVNQINRAVNMKRQPGSTFKPILYAAAIDMKKITAATVFPDLPMIHPDAEGDYWIPENSSGGYSGFVTVRNALINSINMISIAIARQVGLKNILEKIAGELHVNKKEIPSNLTVALGSYEVSPLQMARAFSLFPRGGEDIEPYYIQSIISANGKAIYTHSLKPSGKQILDVGTGTIMTSLLQDVVDKGTGKSVRNIGYKGFAAGKTGTSSHFRDAWFVGFNDRYTSAVWVGYDKPTQSLGEGQYGGSVAAPIWGYFQYYTQPARRKDEPYVIHDGVNEIEICKETGKLPASDCLETIQEYFLPDTEPTEASQEADEEKNGENSGLAGKKKMKNTKKIDKKALNEDMLQ
ncbi:MAG: PBP1A family penicillin-binding protein [Spirochaetia bacterium]|nr:PBP1A family penicillin-binding protein [Spirochaetia bacterium]